MSGKRINHDTARRYLQARETLSILEAADLVKISFSSAKRIEKGTHRTQKEPIEKYWRRHKDPFEFVWDKDVLPLLLNNPKVKATKVLKHLFVTYPEQFTQRQLRTLQSRMKVWREEVKKIVSTNVHYKVCKWGACKNLCHF